MRGFKVVDHKMVGARWCASNNFGERPLSGVTDLLVIHNISLPPGEYDNGYIEAFFTNRLPVDDHPYFATIAQLQVSAHLLIKRSGEVVQFVEFDRRAWHAGASCWEGRDNCNDYSIGIELEGTDDEPFERIQYQHLVAVTAALQAAYPKITSERIVGHCDVAPDRKTDPGPYFDWPRFRTALLAFEA